ncbi:MAG TPA: hypothetical protein VFH78_08115 [Candidatus Thermoplasmatota archaeon]|nr:hypothetical protein [Candidatus Thermoplasmatota archaeon]
MRSWQEFVDFVRGTRQRPPPGRKRPLVATLLFAASVAHLPLVYALVRGVELPPAVPMAIGLLAMGLAWSGGVALEGRRRGTAQIFSALAVAQSLLAFVPPIAASTGSLRWLFVLIGAMAVGALAGLRKP